MFYINRQPINSAWGGGAHFFNAFHRFIPVLTGQQLAPANLMCDPVSVILLAGLVNDGSGCSFEQALAYRDLMRSCGHSVKIVVRVNENDARKGTSGTDEAWMHACFLADGAVFVSHWLRQYFKSKGYYRKSDTVIVNGVDREIFKPSEKLDNGLINIVTHHWSNHPLKGFDVYDQLDEYVGKHSDRFSFTYIGRERNSFKHSRVIKPLYGRVLGEELGKYDIYVSASRFDPSPNHCLEALACELPTYVHKDGGGAVELCGGSHSYDDWEHLKSIIEGHDYAANTAIQLNSWKDCVQEYVDYFQSLACDLRKA